MWLVDVDLINGWFRLKTVDEMKELMEALHPRYGGCSAEILARFFLALYVSAARFPTEAGEFLACLCLFECSYQTICVLETKIIKFMVY